MNKPRPIPNVRSVEHRNIIKPREDLPFSKHIILKMARIIPLKITFVVELLSYINDEGAT